MNNKKESKTLSNEPFVSIIIPLYVICDRFFEDYKKYSELNYPKYEILIVCDKKIPTKKIPKARLILTHKRKTGPAIKRDIALKKAKGEICAFIDDDAYPDPDWLMHAVKNFKRNSVIAVGGPGVTPPEDKKNEKLAGLVYESYFCSGATQNRFVSLKPCFIDEWPAYNLFVRKDVLKEVGGYGNDFYGGEDTFLCNKLIKKGKIYYEPNAIVYHHRRKIFFDLLKQIGNVGMHRGFFAKKYPATSRRWFYFLPSILTLGFLGFLVFGMIDHTVMPFFLFFLTFFVTIGTMSVIDKTSLPNALVVGVGIILVHLSYGIYFIKGLLIADLKR
jgi:glycosyltransferase involved in cell wall biosynthesis